MAITNGDFSSWTAGLPNGWAVLFDEVGTSTNQVTVTRNDGAVVTAGKPPAGIISTTTTDTTDGLFATVTPSSGNVAFMGVDAGGQSTLFTRTALNATYATLCRWVSENGDTMELSTTSGEIAGVGSLYMSRNGGAWTHVYTHPDATDPAKRTAVFATPGVVWTGTKHVLFAMFRTMADLDLGVCALDLDADSNVLPATYRELLWEEGYNNQVYTVIRHTNGDIYFGCMRVSTAALLGTFAGNTLRVYKSTDELATVSKVGGDITADPAAGYPRVTGEGAVVELSTGDVRVYWRSGTGYIQRTDVDVSAGTHDGLNATTIKSPSTGNCALRCSDGSLALAFISAEKSATNVNSPRKNMMLAFSDDDGATWSDLHVLANVTMLGKPVSGDDDSQVNQPYIFEIDGTLYIYLYGITYTGSTQTSNRGYQATATLASLRNGNVSSGTSRQAIGTTIPSGSRLALISAMAPATFTAHMISPGNFYFDVAPSFTTSFRFDVTPKFEYPNVGWTERNGANALWGERQAGASTWTLRR